MIQRVCFNVLMDKSVRMVLSVLTRSTASRAHLCDVAPRVAFRVVSFYSTQTLPGRTIVTSNCIQDAWKTREIKAEQ